MKVIIINLIFLIFISSCTRGFRTKKLLYSTPKTAFYEIKRDEVPGKQLLEGKLIHPTKLEASKITDIIGNIKFTKTTRINKFTDFIFHQDQLDSFSEDLSLSLEKLDDKKVLVAISQHDHLNSVISTYKRTSFYMWVNEEGLNIVFGEIQGDVPWEDSGNFYDWTQIEKITLG
ncbi:MAG: hypothetical protein KDK36_11805, partial [Leptospiraceae bacterium]|nr:hypothetical protein [Leptospiraceae bacterium]